MKFSTFILMSVSILTASAAWAGGRSPASLPRPASQGEQMLNSVWDPSPAFNRPIQRRGGGVISVIGVCKTAYGARFNSIDKGYAGCMDSGSSSADASNAVRHTGAAVLISP